MEGTFGENTKAGDVTSVLGDLWLNEHDVHRIQICRLATSTVRLKTLMQNSQSIYLISTAAFPMATLPARRIRGARPCVRQARVFQS